ncbi:MAG: 50S ribosomal protein L11 methyltransferase [Deltaproteobacteria bacterium]|jgi:ribosomal protein L11 methyltransferase|nr:50S ribosomal protein L11 methyltransferase [Deltaproteobacteria bacterium]
MRPDTLLSIYELRAPSQDVRSVFDRFDLKTLVGPQLQGFHWETDFAFLFCTAKADLEPLLRAVPGLELRKEHLLRYDEWQDGAGARPIVLGPLSILPWEGDEPPARTEACTPGTFPPVYVDPGLAFGYGGHPTTKACLGFLLRIMDPRNPKPPRTFLDLGSGTGVLSLAALRLGGERALGVDYSHLAAECARNNARINGLADKAAFEYGLATGRADFPAEVLMANIPLAVHLELLELGAYSGRRYLIISGLLPQEADELKARLRESLKFRELDNHRDDRWSSWLLETVTGPGARARGLPPAG